MVSRDRTRPFQQPDIAVIEDCAVGGGDGARPTQRAHPGECPPGRVAAKPLGEGTHHV